MARRHSPRRRFAAWLLWALLATTHRPANAEIEVRVSEPQRLSALLASQQHRFDAVYWPGVSWRVPEEIRPQAAAKQFLLESLHRPELAGSASPAAREALIRLVEALPVTGRVVLEKVDPRWLEVHPDKDPVLRPGQRLVLPRRPKGVRVLLGDGRQCDVAFEPARYAHDYLIACDAETRAEVAWIVQPDGIVQRRGVALWNQQVQDAPAPGAWIVAADPRHGWNAVIYEQLARLLATQGPAPVDTASVALGAGSSSPFRALAQQGIPVDLALTGSNWGTVGLLQTPTARMEPAGAAAMSLHRTYPYTWLNFNLQPFDWLETSFRYMDVANRLYGPDIAGDQSYKDKSIDVKLRLMEESAYRPQLAVGVRDLTGTGLFSGEYLVASKRTGRFDWSLGLGWGYLGARGDLGNPLQALDKRFKRRPSVTESTGVGGKINFSSYFRGPTALFGGVQYQTPWDDLLLKLEYDGNDYQKEPEQNNQPQSSPFNLGAIWRYSDSVDLSLGWERGNTLMLGVNFHGRLDRLSTPKLHDPKPAPVAHGAPTRDPDWGALAHQLEATTGWRVERIRRAGSELLVRFDEVQAFYWHDFIDRVTALLHRDVPGGILVFRIQCVDFDLRMKEFLIDRTTWVESKTRYLAPHERHPTHWVGPYAGGFVTPYDETLIHQAPRPFRGDYGIYYQQNLGGPDGFILYQAGAKLAGTWQPRPDTWFTAVLHGRVLDNYANFKYTAPSQLPRVRTYLREYLTTSQVTLPVAQLTHVGRLTPNQYYSLYGGMLESMYGGVGGEWLYRPFGSPVALGLDLNVVKQRGFAQDFSFCNRAIHDKCIDTEITGHVSLYWDTGIQNIQATLQAGRYLAGDTGITLDLARVFDNGVRMGAWFTRTNVPAEVFGEGSFDKGIYVSIPFDAMMLRSSSSFAHLVWQPLIRDGGARLNRSVRLVDLTRPAKGDALRWRAFDGRRNTQFGDVRDIAGEPSEYRSVFDAAWDDLELLGAGVAQREFWSALFLAGGVTAVSSVFDRPFDELARRHGNRDGFAPVKVAGNWLPLASAGFSGAMFALSDDPWMARASYASLAAGGVAAAAALGMKYAIGRARPESGAGPGKFDFMAAAGGDSAMPSMHSAVAWATLTPYAKAYRAPWLYGAAALTNVARIGSRKHWFSDTVAGALLGYGLGSFFWEARSRDRAAPSLYVGPGEIGLNWQIP